VPYVKTSVRTTRSGTVRYLQLAHNEWDAEAQRSRTRVLHNFGREDEIDKDQVRRLVSALSRLLDPAEALAASEPGELSVSMSRPLGGTHALDALWRRLTANELLRRATGFASITTGVALGIYTGILLSAGELRPLIVLFTDGEGNSSWLGAADLRLVVERSNALVHVVGWRPPRSPEELRRQALPTESLQERTLREIAEAAGGRYWQADSPDRLRRAFSAIADAMGRRYVLRYEPTGVAREGWHRIDARLRRVKGDVHVRRGYWVAGRAAAQP